MASSVSLLKGKIAMQHYSSTQSGAQFNKCHSADSRCETSQIHQMYYLHDGHKKKNIELYLH